MKKIEELYNTIIKGDSTRIVDSLPDNSIDLLFTGPPYWNSNISKSEMFEKWFRILKRRGAILLVTSNRETMRWGYAGGKDYKTDIVWEHEGQIANPLNTGKNWACTHKNILVFYKDKTCPDFKPQKISAPGKKAYYQEEKERDTVWEGEVYPGYIIQGEEGVRLQGSVLKYPRPKTNRKEFKTTCRLNVDLCKMLITAYCPENGIVLDPFVGSGSIGEASLLVGRYFLGIDNNKIHVNTARKRMKRIVCEL